MSFHWGNFKLYCERQGMQILKDDSLFIQTQLAKIPRDRQRILMIEYTKRWMDELKTKDNGSQNAGRKAANEYLLAACRN